MRRAAFALVSVASLALLPACDDDSRITPIAASWLEWSDSVTAGTPFGVRVYGLTDAESGDLRVRITIRTDTLTIEPYSVATLVRDQVFPYDTLVWVPAIAATAPRTVVLQAPSRAFESPWPLRTFGTFTVSPDTVVAPLMHSVGIGSGLLDSFSGCFLVIPSSPSRLYVSADQTPDWAPAFSGFVYGRIDPVARSACLDDAYVIQVDSILN